jgi:hypothetical protein
MAKGAEVYDGDKAKWVAASDEQAAHHHAVAAGGKLPSDRTEEDMRKLEPGMAGSPTVTAGPELAPVVTRQGGPTAGKSANP